MVSWGLQISVHSTSDLLTWCVWALWVMVSWSNGVIHGCSWWDHEVALRTASGLRFARSPHPIYMAFRLHGGAWPFQMRKPKTVPICKHRFFPCSFCAWLPAELFGRAQVSNCGQVRVNSSRATVGSCGSHNHSHGTEHPCTGPCMSWGRSALLLLCCFFSEATINLSQPAPQHLPSTLRPCNDHRHKEPYFRPSTLPSSFLSLSSS